MSLTKTNKYLRNSSQREMALRRNARASSIFEGASANAIDAASAFDHQSDNHKVARNASSKKTSSSS
jgi:hypothetical protein